MNITNHGIQITGGTVSGPLAAGAGARAVQQVGAPAGDEHVADLLTLVRDLIQQHAAELGDIRPALKDTDRIEAELQEEDPDRDHLSDTLARLSGRVASVAAIAEAVATLSGLFA